MRNNRIDRLTQRAVSAGGALARKFGLTGEDMANAQQQPYDQNLSYQFHGGSAGGSDSVRKLEAIKLPPLQGQRFLDLGCNAGFFCAHALENGAARVVGVDNSPKVAELARSRHPRAEFFDRGWDVFPDGVFDVTICLSAIHYAEDVIGLFNTIRDHLSENGLFVLEGGLFQEGVLRVTDLPAPCWREVGDRVRHMSKTFLDRHALLGFDYAIVGPSVNQGGDPALRFAMHARKIETVRQRPAHFTLCPAEFARAAAISAPTIQPAQKSYDYVKALGAGALTDGRIAEVLSQESALDAFVDDICFCARKQGDAIVIVDTLGAALTERLAEKLRARGKTAEPESAGGNGAAVMKRMEAGVEFLEQHASEPLAEMLSSCALEGARVGVFSLGRLAETLLAAGVSECHVLAESEAPDNDRVIKHKAAPWHVPARDLKYVFFDATAQPGLDHVDDIARLAEALPNTLAQDGLAYVVLRTGVAQTDWDVYNSILLTPVGRLPSSDYLFNRLLRNFAVRPLVRVSELTKSYCVTRIIRIAPKRPSLLLVAAASQGGKTTISRSLKQSPGAFHLSNDYIFFELFRFRGRGALPGCSPRLMAVVGGGTAEEVGNFFRTVEADDALFKDYLDLIRYFIPRSEMDISFDLDVRRPERLEEAKEYFTDAGFSVWAVTR